MSPGMAGRIPTDWTSLLLIGPAGTGKTTVLWALHRKLVTSDDYWEGPPVYIVSECNGISRCRYDWDTLDELAALEGVLCVDDIGYKKPCEWMIQAAYHLSTERRAHKRRTIWTTNLTREALTEQYGAAIHSRISGGHVLNTGGEDKRLV